MPNILPGERRSFGLAKELQRITIWVFKKVFSVKAIYFVTINLHKCGCSNKLSKNSNKWLFQYNLNREFAGKSSPGKNQWDKVKKSIKMRQEQNTLIAGSAWYLPAMTKISFQEGRWALDFVSTKL